MGSPTMLLHVALHINHINAKKVSTIKKKMTLYSVDKKFLKPYSVLSLLYKIQRTIPTFLYFSNEFFWEGETRD